MKNSKKNMKKPGEKNPIKSDNLGHFFNFHGYGRGKQTNWD